MQFKLVAEPTIESDVILSVPGSDPAKVIMFFKYKAPKIFADWFEEHRPRGWFMTAWLRLKRFIRTLLGKPVSPMLTAREVCLLGVTGWKEVYGEDGKELPFSQDNLVMLLDGYPRSSGEIVQAYFRAVVEGHLKNLKR